MKTILKAIALVLILTAPIAAEAGAKKPPQEK